MRVISKHFWVCEWEVFSCCELCDFSNTTVCSNFKRSSAFCLYIALNAVAFQNVDKLKWNSVPFSKTDRSTHFPLEMETKFFHFRYFYENSGCKNWLINLSCFFHKLLILLKFLETFLSWKCILIFCLKWNIFWLEFFLICILRVVLSRGSLVFTHSKFSSAWSFHVGFSGSPGCKSSTNLVVQSGESHYFVLFQRDYRPTLASDTKRK